MVRITFDDLKTQQELCRQALEPVRSLVHSLCSKIGAKETCPYKDVFEPGEIASCQNCAYFIDKEKKAPCK